MQWLRSGVFAAGVCALSCASAPEARAAPTPPVRYRIEIPRPESQYVHVTLTVPAVRGTRLAFAMPAWIPGSYKVRDYARHVYDVQARAADGSALPISRIDKQTWSVEHRGRAFEVRYRVFADERSVRANHVDDRHASLNGPALLMYVPALRDRACELEVVPPPTWNVHVALPGSSAETSAFRAADYDALVDAPLELGTPQVRSFETRQTRFEYVLTGAEEVGADIDRLSADAQRMVEAMGRAMDGFPMQRYLFLAAITPEGGGGLEHDNSTMMMMSRDAFATDRGYRRAIELAAHEFFHLWNVRRIRDRALRPYDYRRENYTELLWFHEGFTEAIETLVLVRAGLVSPDAFLEELGEQWSAYLRKPGRNYAPISTLSFEAWTKAYQPAANHPNVAISYYEKGKFLGHALDLEIRLRARAHGGRGDLFGVFRSLMRSHGSTNTGITHDDIVDATSREAGEDMRWFFDRFVHGTEEVPLPQRLVDIGVRVVAVPDPGPPPVDTGLDLDGTTVRNIAPAGPAMLAGLMRGDRIIAIDGYAVSSNERLDAALARGGAGARHEVHLFRDGRLLARSLTTAPASHDAVKFELADDDTLAPDLLELRAAWLETWAAGNPTWAGTGEVAGGSPSVRAAPKPARPRARSTEAGP